MTKTAVKKSQTLDEKLLRALREDSVDESVIEDEINSLSDSLDYSDTSCRSRLAHVLESAPLEIGLVILVFLDVFILIIMLVLDLHIREYQLKDAMTASAEIISAVQSGCGDNYLLDQYNGSSLLQISKYLMAYGCTWRNRNQTDSVASHQRTRRAASTNSDEYANPSVIQLITATHVLHFLSIAILAILVCEVLLKIYSLGFKKYFKGKLEVIDGLVIIISFTLDVYFTDGVSDNELKSTTSLLVVLLLWRIVRVFNALLVAAKKRLQFRIRVQKRMCRSLEEKINSLEKDLKTRQTHIENLELLAELYDIPDYKIRASMPLVKTLQTKNTSAGLASMMQMSMGILHGVNTIKLESIETEQQQINSVNPAICDRMDEDPLLSQSISDVPPSTGTPPSQSLASISEECHCADFITNRQCKQSNAVQTDDEQQ